jgi:Sec-independent protein translocase protein TatA
MLALIGNLDGGELVIIVVVAVLIFGRRLPEVAGQAAGMVGRLRRTLESLWQETGIDHEVRKVRREMERFERELPRDLSPGAMARRATERIWNEGREDVPPPAVEGGKETDTASAPGSAEPATPRIDALPAAPPGTPPGTAAGTAAGTVPEEPPEKAPWWPSGR